MSLSATDLVVLLGAGASYEADIPVSKGMIDQLEKLLRDERSDWSRFQGLYHHIKSGILFGAGIKGKFDADVNFNIEVLANTLYELERNEDHPIYPFVGSWNSRLLALAGPGLSSIRDLRTKIVKQLQSWVQPERAGKDDYYRGLYRLQAELNHPLRVFSLNYDLCVERLAAADVTIEGGFGPRGDRAWSWDRFGEQPAGADPVQLYLYKLHGSINWRRDKDGLLYQLHYSGDNLKADDLQVIFGREFKLDAADPYLLYAYEFRRLTREARVILVVGYSFSDPHINKVLCQALRDNARSRMLVVDKWDPTVSEGPHGVAALRVECDPTRVIAVNGGARAFLEAPDIFAQVAAAAPAPPDVGF